MTTTIQAQFIIAAEIVDEFCAAFAYYRGNEWYSSGGLFGVIRKPDGEFTVRVWDVDCEEVPVEGCGAFVGETPEQAMQQAIEGMREFVKEQLSYGSDNE